VDEPEAALSQRQLGFLVLLNDLLTDNNDVQFLIAAHSPILLAYPDAQILSFDDGHVHEIGYRESRPFQFVALNGTSMLCFPILLILNNQASERSDHWHRCLPRRIEEGQRHDLGGNGVADGFDGHLDGKRGAEDGVFAADAS